MTQRGNIVNLPTYTAEQLQELRAKAIASRQQKAEERKANAHLYKTEYLDSGYWDGLFQKHNLRAPNKLEPCSVKGMRKYLNKLSVETPSFTEATGISKLQDWIDLNPRHTLYGFVGNLLEMKETLPS